MSGSVKTSSTWFLLAASKSDGRYGVISVWPLGSRTVVKVSLSMLMFFSQSHSGNGWEWLGMDGKVGGGKCPVNYSFHREATVLGYKGRPPALNSRAATFAVGNASFVSAARFW